MAIFFATFLFVFDISFIIMPIVFIQYAKTTDESSIVKTENKASYLF